VNGTYVNGRRLSEERVTSAPYELHTGDELVGLPCFASAGSQLTRLQVIGIDVTKDGAIVHQKVAARVVLA
jgi:hypothetical protein